MAKLFTFVAFVGASVAAPLPVPNYYPINYSNLPSYDNGGTQAFAAMNQKIFKGANVGAFQGTGSTGNIGAFQGLGNTSPTSGNNNLGAFNGNVCACTYVRACGASDQPLTLTHAHHPPPITPQINGGMYNGNMNVGAFNGNFNGLPG